MIPDLPGLEAAPVEALELARLMDSVGEVVVYADQDWVIWYCNDAYLKQTGLKRSEVLGRTPFEFQPLFRRSIFYDPIEKCRVERRPMAALGYSTLLNRCLLMRVFPVDDGMMLLANDATESVIKQFQLAQTALEDPLTALPNKLALLQDVQAALEAGERLTIAMIGLQQFRAINDAQGFASADIAMIEIASRMQQATLPQERLYRLTADEFALVHPCCSDIPSDERVAQLLEVTRKPLLLKGQVFNLGAAAGLVRAPEHGDEPEILLHRATMSLRQAQRRRGAEVEIYQAAMEASVRRRAELEVELRHALQTGQFKLAFQPKACMTGRHVMGAEALIRWPHPQQGMMSPGEFLPILEECGLMRDVDQWVLHTALDHLQDLLRQGIEVPVAINLSVDSLADPELVGKVSAALREKGVPAELLEIEIPEGSVMRDVDTSTRVLSALSELGVHLSIDDFGTGYSSFAYLARFPVQVLKVDRSFVNDMTTSDASRKIVAGLIRLAHSLSLRVIAEGVETRGQMAMLKRMHCDEMQGYGYSHPLQFEHFCQFVQAHRAPQGPSAFSM